VRYLYVSGNDVTSAFAKETLTRFRLDITFIVDESRSTTLKQRFRPSGKTLLRFSHLRQHVISLKLADSLFEAVMDLLADCNLLVFYDFNYGYLTLGPVERVADYCREKNS